MWQHEALKFLAYWQNWLLTETRSGNKPSSTARDTPRCVSVECCAERTAGSRTAQIPTSNNSSSSLRERTSVGRRDPAVRLKAVSEAQPPARPSPAAPHSSVRKRRKRSGSPQRQRAPSPDTTKHKRAASAHTKRERAPSPRKLRSLSARPKKVIVESPVSRKPVPARVPAGTEGSSADEIFSAVRSAKLMPPGTAVPQQRAAAATPPRLHYDDVLRPAIPNVAGARTE